MSLLYDTHFPGGFHDSGYHALMEMSRYNYNITHLYVYLFPCVYVVLRRSQAGRWSMQRASDYGVSKGHLSGFYRYRKLFTDIGKWITDIGK